MVSVLFLCTHNSMRGIVAESILRASTKGRFNAFSAGIEALPAVDERVLAFLRERHLPTDGLRAKSWLEFTGEDAPQFGFVIALSARAAAVAEEHPWPGGPVVAHWTIDEADAAGEDERSAWAIRDTFWVLSRRIKIFASLPHGKSSRLALQNRLHALEAWQ